MVRCALVALAVAGLAVSAAAQSGGPSADMPQELGLNAAPPSDSARFRLTPVEGGVLRIDSGTGQVSHCSARSAGWACQPVPEERAALDTEIGRLQARVDALTKEVAQLRGETLRPPEAVPPSAQGELKVPSRADLDRAKAFIDDAWRRVVDMLEQWRKDLQKDWQKS